MKEQVLELAARQTDRQTRLNIMREYLQTYALRIAHDRGLFRSAAFVGGTALRLIHDLPRFSEDLDFSLLPQDRSFNFMELIKAMKREFELAGYDLTVTYNDQKTVNHAFFRFSDLLQEASLSSTKGQKLSIRLEIDTRPPNGAKTETHIVNKLLPVSFVAYDLASLFAGKLTALLCRRFTKGRDYFDVGWYLSKWKDLCPNIELLSNGLMQAGSNYRVSEETWKKLLRNKIVDVDWQVVEEDVQRLVLSSSEMGIFTRENILRLL